MTDRWWWLDAKIRGHLKQNSPRTCSKFNWIFYIKKSVTQANCWKI